MPPKKKVDLPDHVRAAVLSDVQMTYESALDAKALLERADERSRIRIHLAIEQGLTTYELEAELGVPQPTVSRWARQGKEALERREREKGAREPAGDQQPDEDPLRSGQRQPVS